MTNRERIGRGEMTVEECVYWLAVVQAACEYTGGASGRAAYVAALAVERNVDWLRLEAAACLRLARVGNLKRAPYLTTWALCRAAIRAIERERSK